MTMTFVAENFRDNEYRIDLSQTLKGKAGNFAWVPLPARNGRVGNRSIAFREGLMYRSPFSGKLPARLVEHGICFLAERPCGISFNP